jgi:branched-chain amino acid transport system ATP-binding protein
VSVPILLRVRNLEVRYDDLVGLADVSLEVAQGSVVALLGSNGAGKTTTLNAIAGLNRRSAGSVEWMGEDISELPAYTVVSRGLTLSPEGWRLFTQQTVEQNLRLGATVLKDRTRRRCSIASMTFFPVLPNAGVSAPARCRAVSARCSHSAAP